MRKTFLVSWINGDDLGTYKANDEDDAILAAVQDAGYRDLQDASEFIYDRKGNITLQVEEL